MPATEDPVRVLLSAAQQGLLEYVGYTGDDLYEVRVGGEVRQLRGAAARALVQQLRALSRLRDSGVPSEALGIGPGTGPFRLVVGGVAHDVRPEQLVDWVDGYLLGLIPVPWPAAHADGSEGEDRFAAIRKVLERPGLADQARLVILGLMYGDPGREVSMEQLGVLAGRTKKTIIDALSFGRRTLTPEFADVLVAAFGRRWRLSATGYCEAVDVDGRPAETSPEMPGIRRLRLINTAERRGWLRYMGEPSPNRARWDRSYQLTVGAGTYTVSAESLPGWLLGLEAWFAQAGRGDG